MKYIELNAFLTINGIAPTGGQAKNLIRSEKIKVNGNIETRNKKKLFPEDKVIFNDKVYIVKQEICLKEKK